MTDAPAPIGGAPPGHAPLEATAVFAQRLGHRFADATLLEEALTHRSASPGGRAGGGRIVPRGTGSNERLEFIGDRVLGLVVAEWLLERFPREQEGELGRRHAHLVSRDVLAAVALALGLAGALRLAPDAARAGIGDGANTLADALEAVLGALFLDGGLAPPRRLVRARWAEAFEALAAPPVDPKTALQEWLLARGLGLPVYRETGREGPSHAPRFAIEAEGGGLTASGVAPSKRAAERAAAAALLLALGAGAPKRRARRRKLPA